MNKCLKTTLLISVGFIEVYRLRINDGYKAADNFFKSGIIDKNKDEHLPPSLES